MEIVIAYMVMMKQDPFAPPLALPICLLVLMVRNAFRNQVDVITPMIVRMDQMNLSPCAVFHVQVICLLALMVLIVYGALRALFSLKHVMDGWIALIILMSLCLSVLALMISLLVQMAQHAYQSQTFAMGEIVVTMGAVTTQTTFRLNAITALKTLFSSVRYQESMYVWVLSINVTMQRIAIIMQMNLYQSALN